MQFKHGKNNNLVSQEFGFHKVGVGMKHIFDG
jgi:hypothetical protein